MGLGTLLFCIGVLLAFFLLVRWAKARAKEIRLESQKAERNWERQLERQLREQTGALKAEEPIQPVAPPNTRVDSAPAAVPSAPQPVVPIALESSAVAAVMQKLYIAGLISGEKESLPVPDLAVKAAAVRFKGQKKMLIVPSGAPQAWLDTQLERYDSVCVASETRPRVITRLEDFLADQMFR